MTLTEKILVRASGRSREHAPISLGAAGVDVIVAESYARIFFRNSVATGELYPYEARERLIDMVKPAMSRPSISRVIRLRLTERCIS
jgi:3-isopropylmalate dehydratase small subunit